jgi:hypothetical protein
MSIGILASPWKRKCLVACVNAGNPEFHNRRARSGKYMEIMLAVMAAKTIPGYFRDE